MEEVKMQGLLIGLAILSFIGLYKTAASAQTIEGQTVLASYTAPGLCAQANREVKEIRLAACARNNNQDFHIEYFHDIARHESKKKIMNGKDCLQAGWMYGRAIFHTERCSISTWSKSAFWGISASSGDLFSEEHYCAYRQDNSTNIGDLLISASCRWFEGAELYPAIVTRSARVGPLTMANYTQGQRLKAIITENSYSGGNLVASEGAELTIDRSGRVSATNGGYIIAGGAGYRIGEKLSQVSGSNILRSSDYVSKQPNEYSPISLDFFTEKTRGKLDYVLH